MLLIVRKIKHSLFERSEFRRYLLYAFGEMVLVIVGILIALQIDNWNTERQQEASLDNYLDSIARNIRADMKALRAVRDGRLLAFELAERQRNFLSWMQVYDADQIAFGKFALDEAQRNLWFGANRTGFDALKSAGVLDQLQGRDIEVLLYDYYDTVRGIESAEADYNSLVRQIRLQMLDDFPAELGTWELDDPHLLAADRIEEIQPWLGDLFGNSATITAYSLARSTGPLLREYEKLELLGETIIRMTSMGQDMFDDNALTAIKNTRSLNSAEGYPDLIIKGQPSHQRYMINTAASVDTRLASRSPGAVAEPQPYPFAFDSIERVGDELRLSYEGGVDWAVMFMFVDGWRGERPSLDFSGFDVLEVEMKGNQGGEVLRVHLKDSTDPDDGSQTNIPVTLTDDWKTYTFDLDRFENADLSRLHVVLGFLFYKDPAVFSIRSARYVDRESGG